MWPYVLIALAGSAASIVLALVAKVPTYKVAPAFLIPIIWAPLAIRRRLHLHPVHYALYVIAVFLHNLGALGWYQKWPFNVSFDILVHFYFAFAAGFIVFRLLDRGIPALKTWQIYAATLLFLMGFGALHELMEYASTLALGEERGMVKTTGYKYDTQRDLLNNLLGVSLSLVLMGLTRVALRRSSGEERSGSSLSAPNPA
jgi:uncharacterized membrane protein YjdF